MKVQKTKIAVPVSGKAEMKKPAYIAPKLVIYRGADFIRKLGPAQAGSYS